MIDTRILRLSRVGGVFPANCKAMTHEAGFRYAGFPRCKLRSASSGKWGGTEQWYNLGLSLKGKTQWQGKGPVSGANALTVRSTEKLLHRDMLSWYGTDLQHRVATRPRSIHYSSRRRAVHPLFLPRFVLLPNSSRLGTLPKHMPLYLSRKSITCAAHGDLRLPKANSRTNMQFSIFNGRRGSPLSISKCSRDQACTRISSGSLLPNSGNLCHTYNFEAPLAKCMKLMKHPQIPLRTWRVVSPAYSRIVRCRGIGPTSRGIRSLSSKSLPGALPLIDLRKKSPSV